MRLDTPWGLPPSQLKILSAIILFVPIVELKNLFVCQTKIVFLLLHNLCQGMDLSLNLQSHKSLRKSSIIVCSNIILKGADKTLPFAFYSRISKLQSQLENIEFGRWWEARYRSEYN